MRQIDRGTGGFASLGHLSGVCGDHRLHGLGDDAQLVAPELLGPLDRFLGHSRCFVVSAAPYFGQ
ncbi:hypothetical protein ABQF26_28520, partial [Mycolicibacterium elephantis]